MNDSNAIKPTSSDLPASSRSQPDSGQTVRLRYPGLYALVGWICLLVFGALVPLSQAFPGNRAPLGAVVAFVGFALLGAVIVWFTQRGVLSYGPSHVRYVPLAPKPARAFAWSDIRGAEFNAGLQVVVLTLADRSTVWVSIYLENYQEFLAEAERRTGIRMPVVVDLEQTPGAFVEPDDELVQAAAARARESLPNFLAAWRAGRPGDEDFCLKIRVRDGEVAELVWLGDLAENGEGVLSGLLDNPPVQVRNLRVGQRIGVDPSEILDWAYRRDGRMVGNFSLRALLPRMSASEARKARALLSDAELG